MNQFIIIATDSLRAVGTNACHPDTIVCKMISSQDAPCTSDNWTLLIILIFVLLLLWLIVSYLLRYKKMKFEEQSHYVDLLLGEYAKKEVKDDVVNYLKNILKRYSCYRHRSNAEPEDTTKN